MRTRAYYRRRPAFRRPIGMRPIARPFVRPRFFRRRWGCLLPGVGLFLFLILLLWVLRPPL
ncbi:MAG: hypothetical protein U0670_07615 [Anaerolineae bacterium]